MVENIQILVRKRGRNLGVHTFDKNEVTIGTQLGNDLEIVDDKVSKRHARIVLRDSKLILVDLKSDNGTFHNGKRIVSPVVLKTTDTISMGNIGLNAEVTSDAPSERLFSENSHAIVEKAKPDPQSTEALVAALDQLID